MRQITFRHPFTQCNIGLARRDITPPVGIYARNWGAALHDAAEGVHRPFTATAMVFSASEDEQKPLVLLAIDHGWMTPSIDVPFRQKILDHCGLYESQLMVNLSHTHAGPNANYPSPEAPGAHLIQPYLDSLAQSCIEAITEARHKMTQATIVYGTGHCNLAVNRDYFDESLGRFVCGFNPGEETDETVVIGRATDDAKNILATFVNYACHPTTLAWRNRLLSPDYVGATREFLENLFGAPAVFLQGASGELNPRDAYQEDAKYADCNGRQLGHAAASALEGLLPAGMEMYYTGMMPSGANLGTWGYRSIGDENRHRASVMDASVVETELPVKPHPALSELQAAKDVAKARVDAMPIDSPEEELRQARLELELATRTLRRWQAMPEGDTHTQQSWVWRLGEAIFVGVQAEPYSYMQRTLRGRFHGAPIIVMGVTNGWLAYLCPREVYDRGIYQESICPYQAGCLEKVTDAVGDRIEEMLHK